MYSDHEFCALDEAQWLAKRKADLYDEEEDEQDIMLVQDLEDVWEQKFLQFKPGARITGLWSFPASKREGKGRYFGSQTKDICLAPALYFK